MATPRNQKLRHENFLTDMTPLVTIYTPVYNGEKHIGKCIESILNQTYRNIQYLIIDDCSTDNTPDIIRSYDDPRIEYVRRNQNKGFPYCEDMMHLMRGYCIILYHLGLDITWDPLGQTKSKQTLTNQHKK